MITALVLSSFAVAYITFVITQKCNDTRAERLEAEREGLRSECKKLVDHVLWMEHDKTLGGEMDIALIPDRLPSRTTELVLPGGHVLPPSPFTVSKSPPDQIDVLLDALETAEITGIKSEKHSVKEVNKGCEGLKPLVTLEFGDVSIRELVWRGGRSWTPDLCWKGHLLPQLSEEQAKRLRKIFENRMAEQATKSLME